mmetsp:Transcript_135221/g.320529  ORF Transcript_135221/g.320529 Transcript_135221/m.320529 type:complete len:343 (+) Transcript_135221:267-1295(+)
MPPCHQRSGVRNLAAHYCLNLLDCPGRDSKVFNAIVGHQNIVLQPDAAKVIELRNAVPVEELAEFRVFLCLPQGIIHEVDSGLNRQHEARLQDPLTPQRLEAIPGVTLSTFRIAAHIMGVDSQEMAEAMRHQHTTHIGCHHFVHVAHQQAGSCELLAHYAVRELVHINPCHTRLHGAQDSKLHGCYGLEDEALIFGEGASCRKGIGDVGSVAVVLAAHVTKNDVAVLQPSIIGGTSMTIVQNCRVRARARNRSVGQQAATSVVVARVGKGAFQLVLHQPWPCLPHHSDVCICRNPVHIPEKPQLLLVLSSTCLVNDGVKQFFVYIIVAEAIEAGRCHLAAAI